MEKKKNANQNDLNVALHGQIFDHRIAKSSPTYFLFQHFETTLESHTAEINIIFFFFTRTDRDRGKMTKVKIKNLRRPINSQFFYDVKINKNNI